MRRRFNQREKNALYLAAGGCCAACGVALAPGWHADHETPFSRGGATDVANGQALCPNCNAIKGSSMPVTDVIPGVALRPWQAEAVQTYRVHAKRDFLCVATPGAGKTIFVLSLVWQLRDERRVKKTLVVVPTDHLREQWAKSAVESVGLQFDYKLANQAGRLAQDFDGAVVTYQQVAAAPHLFRAFIDEQWLVVFDEIHHAGDAQSWGAAIRQAFEFAGRRLSVTGTPFRSDNNQIPYVQYGADGTSRADFTYGYREAMRDGVCRPVYFPTYGGDVRWFAKQFGDITANFRDDLSDEKSAQRLRAALDSGSGWIPAVIQEADSRLRDIRATEFPDAGGLIIAIDEQHARAVAQIVASITGEAPLVATSYDPDASQIIRRFRDGAPDHTEDPYRGVPRWLVAVKMVSEGVDIPRLCVGVYATTVTTELFFRQAVGRFVRAQGDGLAAWLFVPRDPKLIAHMERITEEREHVVQEARAEAEEEAARQQRMDVGATPSVFKPISADATPEDLIYDEERYSQDELREARAFLLATSMEGIAPEFAVRWLRKTKEYLGYVNDGIVPTAPVAAPKPLTDQKKAEKAAVKALVNRFVGVTGVRFQDVHAALNRRTNSKMDTATMEQIAQRMDILKHALELVASANAAEYDTAAWLRVIRDGR